MWFVVHLSCSDLYSVVLGLLFMVHCVMMCSFEGNLCMWRFVVTCIHRFCSSKLDPSIRMTLFNISILTIRIHTIHTWAARSAAPPSSPRNTPPGTRTPNTTYYTLHYIHHAARLAAPPAMRILVVLLTLTPLLILTLTLLLPTLTTPVYSTHTAEIAHFLTRPAVQILTNLTVLVRLWMSETLQRCSWRPRCRCIHCR
jgi:hypothetical protein